MRSKRFFWNRERCESFSVCACVVPQGEVGGPGQKGSKGDKGELVSVFFSPSFNYMLNYVFV